MIVQKMKSQVDPDILEKWLRGWSLSGELPAA